MYPNQYPPQTQGYPAPQQPQFVQPQYAPQVQQPYQPQTGGDPFADPSRGGGGLAPRIRHLEGRTVIFEPVRIDETTKGKNGESRPTAYAHMTVVDGPPIIFGDDLEKHTPATHKVNVPCRFTNVTIGNTWIVNAIRDDLPPMGRGLLLGVVMRGTQGNRPYLLTKVGADQDGNERSDGEARRAAALALWRAHEAGQWISPIPELLPQAAAAQVNYGPPPQQVNYAHPQYANANPGTGAPGQHWAQQQYTAPQQPQTYGPPAAQFVPNTDVPQQQVPQGPGMLGVPGTAFDVNTPPPGWDAGMWGNFNPEQRAQVWAQINAAGQQQPPPSPMQQQSAQGGPPPF